MCFGWTWKVSVVLLLTCTPNNFITLLFPDTVYSIGAKALCHHLGRQKLHARSA